MRPEDESQARREFERYLRARELQDEPEAVRELLWDAFSWALGKDCEGQAGLRPAGERPPGRPRGALSA
ncbi:hypothetical protein [Vulcaniibacterium tengchongense]|uniref:Uncharacterized protein n=1 Tax=Vulcaniibacterium tengchongense TaxID=1273429 RepID=A0A3N4VCX3_9GAMM|nr:hypothetical protein [Vulcaniibacterium tengchongense]RPE79663.1 hypothetical protein EDC50_1486 [Vulcaniibacterium tengchongense]